MNPLEILKANCPYCGEAIELTVEVSPFESAQTYTEDCSVCCRPMVVKVFAVEEGVSVSLQREDD